MEFLFEKEAMRNDPVPRELDFVDLCLYIALRGLYASYYSGRLTRLDAQEEKEKLVQQYGLCKSRLIFLNRESAKLKERIKNAAKEYEENPNLINADRLYAAFYALPENWRENSEFDK